MSVECELSVDVGISPLTASVNISTSINVGCILDMTVDCDLGISLYTTIVPYTHYYSYDIVKMIDEYTIENLEMDDTLAMLIIPTVLSLDASNKGNIASSSNYLSWVNKVINLYNKNEQYLHEAHKLNTIGTLNAKIGGLL